MSRLSLYYDVYACTGPAAAQAPELVLLHGWGLHSVCWDPIMPALLTQFQVTVIDLPGMGRSPLPGGEYTLDYLITQVLRVAPERAHWMGWSLGGQVALALAARHPERVQSLTLVASNPSFVQRPDWPNAMPPGVLSTFQTTFEEEWDGTLIRFLSLQCRGSATMKQDIRFLQEIVYLQGLPAREALRAGLQGLATWDLRPEWAQLTLPVHVMLGQQDLLVPVAVGAALQASRPTASITVLPCSAHVPFLSEPEAFVSGAQVFWHDLVTDR